MGKPRHFTDEDRAKAIIAIRAQPAEKRVRIARMAALHRWYGENANRHNRLLRHLAQVSAAAQESYVNGDFAALSDLAGKIFLYEKLDDEICNRQGRPGGGALDITNETQKRMQEMRAKRKKALEENGDGGAGEAVAVESSTSGK